jgi:hypothetical protein
MVERALYSCGPHRLFFLVYDVPKQMLPPNAGESTNQKEVPSPVSR